MSLSSFWSGIINKIGVEKCRFVKPHLKGAIYGEHGDNPEPVKFCKKLGLKRALLSV
ncbi:hypothetical protein [Chryseobacterium sp. MP_3.2]|uniref:hypothetical protein n=1 Tax=Chryseobacterium sp. MP_3.2 TaxID=3071712 RepID=UPI002DFFA858|nr:hypothetical protein [Chryseobacterium sp. MP_3.2]